MDHRAAVMHNPDLHALPPEVTWLGGIGAAGDGQMNDVTLDTLEAVGGALGHKGRLRILALLREGDRYACQIRAVLGLAASTVSVHLAVLRRGGLVTEQKQGRFVQYGLTDEEPLGSVVREILHLVKEDRRVMDDARLLEAVRRVPLGRLCRAGLGPAARLSHGPAGACRQRHDPRDGPRPPRHLRTR